MQKERGSHDCLSLHSSHYAYLVLYSCFDNTLLTYFFFISVFSPAIDSHASLLTVSRIELLRSDITAGYNVPVDNLPKLLESIETAVTIVDIVGMFPHIENQ